MAKVTARDTYKSLDTEEWLDRVFTRPVGLLWARLFIRLGWTPNAVTVLSIVLGVAAGVLFYFDDLALNALGILLLVQANIFDSTDGQMARMTGRKSRLGRVLDGAAGDLWFVTIYAAICLRLQPQWGVWIWMLGTVAGFGCHTRQARLADYYRNIHLRLLKGADGSELDDSRRLRQDYNRLPWRGNRVWKAFLWTYIRYTAAQEAATPCFQLVRARLFAQPSLREPFLEGSRPLMAYANLLTFNARALTLYASLLVGHPWLYFAAEVTVFTALYVVMHRRHERLCRTINNRQ
ncbi:MAG: CDP-alcohol phosphatidyltransferase family protein [Bacteroidaceae bacterium]|nr:CDP-alcohol phosphatidyltransferase family protein [Bacteroidaceae bacterium]